MKTVCRTMGLARSHVRDLLGRGEDWTDGRSDRTPSDDAGLLAELRQEIADLPSYGYRRACALVNRQRTARGAPRVNAKRVYRVMAQAALLLPKAPRRRQSARTHEGRIAVSRSDLRWCSDGLEIKCDSGQTVTATFAKDCCDREVMAWRAWEGKGLPGEQSNGMAESFVNTFKRDYVARMDLSDAQTVLAQLAAAFEHFNEVHPHSSLKMRSPREFRRQQAAGAEQALYCE